MSNPVPGYPDFRWAKKGEKLLFGALWFNEDPEDTTVCLEATDYPRLYKMDRGIMAEIHRCRDKNWPSRAHGLCGVVVLIRGGF